MCPGEMDKMSIAETTELCARRHLAFVETAEARRLGVDRDAARARLASRLKQSPGTLENLNRGRLKRFCSGLVDGLRDEFIRAAEREIGQLTNELERARAGRSDADLRDAGEIETHLQALREIVNRRKVL